MDKENVIEQALSLFEETEIQDLTDESVEHYGVKGMKWGVRKSKASTGTARKKAGEMTDAELKAVNKRLNLERDYKRMMAERDKENRGVFQKGIEVVGESLAKAGRAQVDSYVKNRVDALVKEVQSS